MLGKLRPTWSVALCVVMLTLLCSVPLLAQDGSAGPDDENGPAAEVRGSGVLTLAGAAEIDADAQNAPAKTTIQPQEKLVPTVESTAALDSNYMIFVPLALSGEDGAGAAGAQQTTAYWRNIKVEGFESVFPNSQWRTFDGDGLTNGEYYWDDDDRRSYWGSWSAWLGNDGKHELDPAYSYYANNTHSWMIYGPFSLQNALDARFSFWYRNNSEPDFDKFWWTYSCDNVTYYGNYTSGNSGGWQHVEFPIACLGDDTVWVGFLFDSDGSIVQEGAYVDAIYIQQYR